MDMELSFYMTMDKAKWMKKARKSLRLTQMQLAKILWPELTEAQGQAKMSKYETGRVDPSPETVYAIELLIGD